MYNLRGATSTIFLQQNHRWLVVIDFNFNSLYKKLIENELNGIDRARLELKYKIKTQPNFFTLITLKLT